MIADQRRLHRVGVFGGGRIVFGRGGLRHRRRSQDEDGKDDCSSAQHHRIPRGISIDGPSACLARNPRTEYPACASEPAEFYFSHSWFNWLSQKALRVDVDLELDRPAPLRPLGEPAAQTRGEIVA